MLGRLRTVLVESTRDDIGCATIALSYSALSYQLSAVSWASSGLCSSFELRTHGCLVWRHLAESAASRCAQREETPCGCQVTQLAAAALRQDNMVHMSLRSILLRACALGLLLLINALIPQAGIVAFAGCFVHVPGPRRGPRD